MASRSEHSKIQGFLLGLPSNRKRAIAEDGAEEEIQQNKKRHILTEDTNRDDDNISLDSDMEALFNEADDGDDAEQADHEPEQGPVLWSEDQEVYPACAVYHADVKKHQYRITELTVNITDQLSRVRQEGDDIAKLHAEAVACQKFPELKNIVVALVGDAGSGMMTMQNSCGCADCASGKSSLINSVLDIPHVSQEVFTICVIIEHGKLIYGSRVTSVVHAHAPLLSS
jgi:lipopolysaccharide export system protein LptA